VHECVERPPSPAKNQVELRHAQLEIAVVEGTSLDRDGRRLSHRRCIAISRAMERAMRSSDAMVST
jgi:hypothetical protein